MKHITWRHGELMTRGLGFTAAIKSDGGIQLCVWQHEAPSNIVILDLAPGTEFDVREVDE
jgi:hypothetical protein